VFIKDNEPDSQVISLTLIPKDVPAQTVSLMLDGAESSTADRKSDAAPNSYVSELVAKFRSIAMGKAPQGFSSAKMPPTIAREGDLIIIPEERFSGQKLDIYRYRVEDAGKSMVELAETSFYENGVRGVAIYPNLKLDAGEWTYVFVAADKGMSDSGVPEPAPLAVGD
jgi:conjugal transfer pilus assembly protein TraK